VPVVPFRARNPLLDRDERLYHRSALRGGQAPDWAS
jgi:hypothetical protein